jgi:hypothetical protein
MGNLLYNYKEFVGNKDCHPEVLLTSERKKIKNINQKEEYFHMNQQHSWSIMLMMAQK